MVSFCPERQEQRKSLLSKLKSLVDQIDDKAEICCPPCCPTPCCPAPCCPAPCCAPCCPPGCPPCGPVIEIYDPLPKPCVPVCSPPCGPCAPCCSPCCPAPCCPAPCPPPCGPCCAPAPPSCPVPVCSPCCPAPVLVPPCLPICQPVPPPCVPICNPCPEEQPCVPCNPPQMMVCYRRPTCPTGSGNRSKSRELRASVLYSGCDCEKRNGLQDDCPRSECHGSPQCLTKPDPSCGPSEFSNWKHLGRKNNYPKMSKDGKPLEEYQCYPAFVKLPGQCNPCCPPASPCCAPGVPLIPAPPCPPTICPGPSPCVPVGTCVPVQPFVPCQPCPPPMVCCPPYCPPCPC